MALFLLLDHDNTNPNPIKDERGCYKRGMIVEVYDDSRHDGDLVRNPVMPPWVLIRVTGVTKEQALKYMQPRYDTTGLINDNDGNPAVVGRRLYRVLLDTLPAAIRSKILQDRYAEVSQSQIRDYIQNLRDGSTGG